MKFNKAKEMVDNIIKKYYKENDECYTSYRWDENDTEYNMKNEIREFLNENNINYSISYEDGFDSCGFSEDFMAVAFTINGKLYLETVLFEYR